MELRSRFVQKRAWAWVWSWTPPKANADNLLRLDSAVDHSECAQYEQSLASSASKHFLNVWTVRLRTSGTVRLITVRLVVDVQAPMTVWEQSPMGFRGGPFISRLP